MRDGLATTGGCRHTRGWWVLVLGLGLWLSLGGPARIQGEQMPDPISEKYASLGGPNGFLGMPTTDELITPDGIGRFRHYQGGSIYWSPRSGVHEVHGDIRAKWAELGWERSQLGYPTTDETGTPDGIGRFTHFQAGSIYWTPQTGAHEVHGDIRAKWAKLGWERSYLGFPLTDEASTPDNVWRYNQFQGGFIEWSPQTGAIDRPGP